MHAATGAVVQDAAGKGDAVQAAGVLATLCHLQHQRGQAALLRQVRHGGTLQRLVGVAQGAGKVEEVVFQKTGSNETFSVKCGLVITAIGYDAASIPGVPYERGKVLNNEGRVSEGMYVVGWAKRGPSGVIGTNKSDAAGVIELIISNLTSTLNKLCLLLLVPIPT